jgi:drug/metabolite transporter (DMT)-like permease
MSAAPPDKRLRADLLLLTIAVVWGSAFAAQRVAAAHLGFFFFNGLRFLLGGLVVLAFLRGRVRGVTAGEVRGGLLVGLIVFAGSAFQQSALRYTTAGKAGFITGLYVVFVPLALALLWRHRLPKLLWAGALASMAGLFLLSAAETLSFSLGDGLTLVSAFIWTGQVLVIDRLVGRIDPLRFAFVGHLVTGGLSLILGLALEADTIPGLQAAWWTVLYVGVFSVGFGYTMQIVAQRDAPPTDAAIILSLEAPFAALAGWLALGELLTRRQLLGAGLMFAGMLLAQLAPVEREEGEAAAAIT